MPITLDTILKKHFIAALAKHVCGEDYEIVNRKTSFMLRNKEEGSRDLHRLIILPPKGYTANAINQTNSHDEAEYAKIAIKGAVREGKQGFSKVKDCLLVASFSKSKVVSELNQPYLTFDLEDTSSKVTTELHSSGKPPFAVVKSDGFGFYHNLINRTDDWLVMTLHKRLRPQKPMDLETHLNHLQDEHAQLLRDLYEGIVKNGDAIFKAQPELVESVIKLPPDIALPALGEMLYVHDTGRHEACTAFSIILKLGKQSPEIVGQFLQNALEINSIPDYYAEQLIQKINKSVRTTPYKNTGKTLHR